MHLVFDHLRQTGFAPYADFPLIANYTIIDLYGSLGADLFSVTWDLVFPIVLWDLVFGSWVIIRGGSGDGSGRIR